MDEFSQSRFRLEARFHHVLVDEFQDTSRAQWELVALLIQSWGEGAGATTSPSIFVVGDRKQSIYRFRDAEAAVLQEAVRYIQSLRPAGNPRRSITKSFRALPGLLAFVNELFTDVADQQPGGGRFTYAESDRFPTTATDHTDYTDQVRDADHSRDADHARSFTRHGSRGSFTGKGSGGQSGPQGQFRAIRARDCSRKRSGSVRGAGGGRDRENSARGQCSRSTDGRAAAGSGRGYRRTFPVARQPSGVRARARAARGSGLRLQGVGLL